MSYIGVQPTAGQYRKLDDISGSFNGSTTTFTTQVGSQNVSAGTAQQLLVSLGGVIQNPITDYTVSTNSITFTTAPAAGLSFFAVLMGEAVNTGTPSDGVVTGAKLSAPFNYNSGLLYLDSSNNRVGIGTTSAGGKLHVSSGSSSALVSADADDLIVENSGNSGITIASPNSGTCSIRFADPQNNDSGSISYNHNDETLRFATFSTERARFDSSGRWLLGTSTATNNLRLDQKLAVVSTGSGSYPGISITGYSGTTDAAAPFIDFNRSTGTSDGSMTLVGTSDVLGYLVFRGADGTNFINSAQIHAEIDGTPGTNDMPGRLIFSTTPDGSATPAERMRIDSTGKVFAVGVYNATTGVGANVAVDSAGHLQRSTSSIKYKTDVETLEDMYADALLQCRPVWYRSTCAVDDPKHSYWGFIAEEVAEIDPRLVHWKTTEPVVQENGSIENVACVPEPEGVAYERFVPHLLNMIKRQKEQIEAMEARLAALESA